MVNAAKTVRDACADETIRFAVTPRELKTWARLVVDGFSVERAAYASVLNKCERDDLEPVKALMMQAFPTNVWKS